MCLRNFFHLPFSHNGFLDKNESVFQSHFQGKMLLIVSWQQCNNVTVSNLLNNQGGLECCFCSSCMSIAREKNYALLICCVSAMRLTKHVRYYVRFLLTSPQCWKFESFLVVGRENSTCSSRALKILAYSESLHRVLHYPGYC